MGWLISLLLIRDQKLLLRDSVPLKSNPQTIRNWQIIYQGPRERQSDKWTWMTFAGPGMLSSHAGVSILTLLWGTSSVQVSGQMSWMELTAHPPPRVAK